MTNCGVKIKGAPEGNWMILDVLKKLKEKQFLDITETMMAGFEKYKCPTEIKSTILKQFE